MTIKEEFREFIISEEEKNSGESLKSLHPLTICSALWFLARKIDELAEKDAKKEEK